MPLDSDSPHPLAAIGWCEESPAGIAWRAASAGRVARVTEQQRAHYVVSDGAREFRVQPPAAWRRKDFAPSLRAAVGDWVQLDAEAAEIVELLPRSSLFKRGAAGEQHRQQLIAANIDVVLAVTGLDGDFNPRRIERYLVLVMNSGARAVVVLTKADRCEEVAALRARLADIERVGVPVHALDARDPASVAELHPYLGRGTTAVLVGSSGAGKSTLTNTLLGGERMKTGAVRETDSRGRHTTTHRALIPLPQGGCLIDTPGMRELKLTGEEELADTVFDDLAAYAARCKFRDCRHEGEPGCAVRATLERGEIEPGHLENYRKLQAELARASDSLAAQQARKAAERVGSKALDRRLTEKYGKR